MSFDDDGPQEFTFNLTTPARDATHFSVQSQFDAVVYSGEQTHELKLGNDWSTVDSSLFGDEQVKMRFGKATGFFGDSFGLTVSPTSARDFIEAITITVDSETYESQMSSWDDSEITYMFEGEFAEGATAEVTPDAQNRSSNAAREHQDSETAPAVTRLHIRLRRHETAPISRRYFP